MCQVPYPGYPGTGNVWTGGEMSEYEDARGSRGQSGEEQACVLQPKYDGGDDPRIGEFSSELPDAVV